MSGPTPTGPTPTGPAGRRILIVEDEMVVQLHLSRIVEELGYDVVGTAADRDEALEIAAQERPHLVLMDIHLASGTDGVDTASRLVEQLDCAVIFISAYADQATVERTEQVGAAGYLVKPFTQAQVRAAIATAFASHGRLQKEKDRTRSLTAMLQRMGGAVFVVDGDGRITFANQSAAELCGWPVYKTYGRPFVEVVGAAASAAELASAMARARDGDGSAAATIEVTDPAGKVLVVDLAMETIEDEDSPGQGLMLSLRRRDRQREAKAAAPVAPAAPAIRTEKRAFGAGTRLLVYSHDTFGLGHLRRCTALIKSVCARYPAASVLLVTGSPMVHRYGMPHGSDYVKLPALVKVEAEQYEARSLQISGDSIRMLRSNLILHTVRDYRPNVLLVDHSPTGGKGELLPSLEWLRERGGCQRILGLRDVIDDPDAVVSLWQRTGIYDVLERHYDHVVVYGNREYYDPVTSYRLPASVAQRASFLNYVCNTDDGALDGAVPSSRPLVLVTIGGGDGGGETVIEPFLQMMQQFGDRLDFDAEVLTGPFVDPEVEQRLREMAEDLPVRLRNFVPSTAALMRRADLVIATAGYNTVTDVLSLARRAVLIPRVLYRQEQWIRAQRLAELGLVTCLHPESVTPAGLFAAVQEALQQEPLVQARARGLPLDGAARFADYCAGLQVDADV
ncbi:MAG: response regulator [Planctomycetota bacterium]